ncbi:hypothetical protein KAI87_01400, partial [Myxococcota bacterium]|nr:hypothetical protein [Myxococcota bacterium]
MRSSLALRSRTFDINLPCALLATTLLLVPQLVYAATPATPATPAAKATGSSSGDLDRAENTVLVTELRAVDVNAEEAKALTAFVAEAYAKATSYNVMTVAELNEVASLQKNLHDMECADDSCMAELSRIANARYVLSGTIGKIGDNLTITLSLLDADTTENIGTGTATAPDMDKLREVIPDAVAQVSQNLSGGEVVRYKLPEGREISFAVMSLKPLGIGKGVATNLTEVLAAEIKSIDGTSVISPSDIQSMLQMEAQKDALDCNDQACLAEIGGALGVDQLVVGNVGKVGKRFVVSLRIVDARSPKALSRVNESFEG